MVNFFEFYGNYSNRNENRFSTYQIKTLNYFSIVQKEFVYYIEYF